jgi:uncharacterized protein (DUF305 family)
MIKIVGVPMILLTALLATAQRASQQLPWKGDGHFAQMITMHHQMGVQMNTACEQKAKHDELKQLCKKMAEGQQRDIEKLKAIPGLDSEMSGGMKAQSGHDMSSMQHGEMQQHKAGDMSTMQQEHMKNDPDMAKMHQEGMAMHTNLESATGDKFDAMFLKNMSKHHQQAIMMSQQCQSNAKSDELKQLCTEMASNQEQENQQLRALLQQWYPTQAAGTTSDSHSHQH